eukprot:Platyproteum_vivax@DN3322_c0_g1_i1.p1
MLSEETPMTGGAKRRSGFCYIFGRILMCLFFPFVLVFHAVRIYCCGCLHSHFWRCGIKCCRWFCCCCFGFIDKDFIAGESSLGRVKSDTARYGPYGKALNNVAWVRASQFNTNEDEDMYLFKDGISATDICQGQLGDCWLLAAMATLAEWPGAIQRLFITKETNPRGRFKLRLYNPLYGKWQVIVIDDFIPVDRERWERSGMAVPKFTKPKDNELWVMLLEKAFAKLCGTYAALEGGQELWALGVMTGGDHARMYRKKGPVWQRVDMIFSPSKENMRASTWRPVDEEFASEELWRVVLGFYEAKSVMCVAGHGAGGLPAGHSYSVLYVGAVKGMRLVRLRNPWGTGQWQGNWGNNSSLWAQHPKVAKAVNFQPINDGSFWMSWVDFCECWTEVSVCHRSVDIHSIQFEVAGDGPCGPCAGCSKGCCKYWCCDGCARLYFPHYSDESTVFARTCCRRI